MIYDVRTYRCRPGTIRKQLTLYGEHGYDIQRRHLGDPVVFGSVETGDVNSYIHIWAYEDAADRAEKRKSMASDPDWQAYLAKSAAAGNLVSQENTIVVSAPFIAG
ncbi:NIPSNAP family protein [Tropicimonas sp.]|uniref:NIPSNAP family protein n=1 Tax=Tropicimonas sp. TaxID=2067044 RepID=UPI003A86DC34